LAVFFAWFPPAVCGGGGGGGGGGGLPRSFLEPWCCARIAVPISWRGWWEHGWLVRSVALQSISRHSPSSANLTHFFHVSWTNRARLVCELVQSHQSTEGVTTGAAGPCGWSTAAVSRAAFHPRLVLLNPNRESEGPSMYVQSPAGRGGRLMGLGVHFPPVTRPFNISNRPIRRKPHKNESDPNVNKERGIV
jgi:hypothetical protein